MQSDQGRSSAKAGTRASPCVLHHGCVRNSAEVTSGHADPREHNLTPAGAPHHSSRVALNWYLSDAEQDALRRAILTPVAA